MSRLCRTIRSLAACSALLVLITSASFATVLCYVDDSGSPYGVDVPGVQSPSGAIAALAQPPYGFTSAIPKDTKLLSLILQPDTSIVEFSRELVAGNVDDIRVELVYQQVRDTLQQFQLSPNVSIIVDGKPLYEYLPPAPVIQPREPRKARVAAASATGLAGKSISLSAGHGLVWLGNSWGYERPVTCAPLKREDDHNNEIMRYLTIYLQQDGATLKHMRCLDKNAGNYASGKPWWQMSAAYWLKNIGYPSSVYASVTGDPTLGTGDSESSDSLRSRPLASDYDGTDIYISLHSNALKGDCTGVGCPTGTATYYDASSAHSTYGAASRTLAGTIQSGIVDVIKNKYAYSSWSDRHTIDSAGGFAETRMPQRPAVLIELAFHDTCDLDGLYLLDNFFRSATMWGVYKGICDYFGTTPTWDFYSCELVSEDFPSTMTPGQTKAVHITLRNRGVLWNEAFKMRLGAVGESDPFTTQTRCTVSGDVEPGQTVTFTLNLTAPTATGTYTTDWRMLRENWTWFGPTIQKNIVVAEPGSDAQPPTIPGNLAATAVSTDQIDLSWVASTDNVGVMAYNVYRGGLFIGSASSTSYSDSGLTADTDYSYQVSAVDPSGNESAKSNVATATTQYHTEYIIDETQAVLSGTWATSTGGYNDGYAWGSTADSVTRSVRWTPRFDVGGSYDVYAWWVSGSNRTTTAPYTIVYNGGSLTVPTDQTANGGKWNLIASDKPFVAGAVGYVQLDNGNGAGDIVVADALRFVLKSVADTQPPTVPTNVSTTSPSTTQINLSWTASTDNVGVTGYNIYRNSILVATSTTNSYHDTGLTIGTAYSYQISAVDAAENESALTAVVIGKTQGPPDLVAPNISAVNATPAKTIVGYPVKLTVVATDNVGVASVTAGPLALTKGPGSSWYTYVEADPVLGIHSYYVTVKDAAGNQKTNNNLSYSTAQLFGLSNAAISSSAAARTGAAQFLFRVWGKVSVTGLDDFTVYDGSGNPVPVHCPSHGLTNGKFASAFGIWNPGLATPRLETVKAQVVAY